MYDKLQKLIKKHRKVCEEIELLDFHINVCDSDDDSLQCKIRFSQKQKEKLNCKIKKEILAVLKLLENK